MSRYSCRDYDAARSVDGKVDRRLAIPSTIDGDTSRQAGRKLDSYEMKSETKSTELPVCRSVKFGLCVLGIWPGVSYAILRRLLCISSMVLFMIFQYRYLIRHFGKEDLSILMDNLSITIAYSMVCIKITFLVSNTRLLEETIAYMYEDWKMRDLSEEDAMTRIAHVSRVFSNAIIGTYAISVFFYAIGSMQTDGQNGTRGLVMRMDLPFETEDTTVYIAVCLSQFLHETCSASMFAAINCLLLTLVLHVCGQIDILREKLSEVTRERDMPKGVMKAVVVRHQRIISFCRNIEGLFSFIALIQFMSSTFIICFTTFLVIISISVQNGSMVVMKFLLFCVVISFDGFLFCFVGEYLSMKSRMIGDAVYESLWYGLKPSQNRDLLFVIVRSQKHLTLTAGKFVDLSLKQFGDVVKAAVSYISVLYAMY